MIINDKIHSFTPTEIAIHLFKEGCFAKMYNEGAMPMECMLFIHKIQKQLYGALLNNDK